MIVEDETQQQKKFTMRRGRTQNKMKMGTKTNAGYESQEEEKKQRGQ